MSAYKSKFMKDMADRGYISQCTDDAALDSFADEEIISGYIGYDCTASSLHVGNLISIMMLRRLQQAGHRPIVVIGGGTTRVGDPSGKDEQRKLITDEQIEKNIAGIKKVFSRFLDFGDGPTDAIMVNNRDWLDGLNYIEFLRDYGRHFSVNRMLSFDSVKLRLDREQPLSFLEFNYMILQAYDFLELFRQYNCRLQMGGSDQWGNIVNGVDLTRRVESEALYGLTTPLLTTSSGAKMGKSVSGAIWLNEDMLSVYDYWQFWRNTEDGDVGKFLRLFTELSEEEINRLEKLEGVEVNEAKKILATEATAMAHGREKAEKAASTSEQTFVQGMAAEGLPSFDVSRSDIDGGLGFLSALVISELANSNGEARRLIKGGGVKINDQTISDERGTLNSSDINEEGTIKISVGKKRHALLKPV